MGKIIRLRSNDPKQRKPEDLIVKCIISDRQIEVDDVTVDAGREAIKLTVTTYSHEQERRRKLCELWVRWDDLIAALRTVDRVEMKEE